MAASETEALDEERRQAGVERADGRYAAAEGFEIISQVSDESAQQVFAALWRGPRLTLHVVGINRDVSDVEGESAVTIIASPAFDRANRARVAAFGMTRRRDVAAEEGAA